MPVSKEERELLRSINKDEWRPVKNSNVLKKQLRMAAKKTLAKDQRMNIRISKKDLLSLKAKALEQGMPYQTLVSSVLHKYVTGQIEEKK